MLRSTSAIRRVPGSEARTRTPIACCDSISPRARTSPCTHKSGWTRSRDSLISDREKRSVTKHQQSASSMCRDDRLNRQAKADTDRPVDGGADMSASLACAGNRSEEQTSELQSLM